MRTAFVLFSLSLLLIGGPVADGLFATEYTVATRELQQTYPGARLHVDRDIASVYGVPMTSGDTPQEAARRFLARHGDIFGAANLDLRLERENEMKNGRFTVFAYQQRIGGVPVEDGIARILVRNGLENRVVLASGKIEAAPNTSFPPNRITGAQALAMIQDLDTYSELTAWSTPELVVLKASGGDDLEDPIRAWTFMGHNDVMADFEAYSFYVNADNGDLAKVRSEIYQIDVSGTVNALITPGQFPDEGSNPPVSTPLENVRVQIQGGNSVFTNPDGTYTIPNGGSSNVTVDVDLVGEWVQVFTDQGTLVTASQVVSPPGPADFTLNSAPAEFNTAQVNTFFHTTGVHNFFKDRAPSFTALDFPITANTNLADQCNAFFSPAALSINFFNAQGGCVNTAYCDVVYHEYGHFIVNRLNLLQGAFGEGFGDCVAFLGLDISALGANFLGPGSFVRQPLVDNVQYPCGGAIHFCGQVLGAVWVRTREGFKTSMGNGPGLTAARQLFVDWALLTLGGSGSNSAHPQTAIEVLTVDDNDGNLNNGTPNFTDICAAFAAHSIPCPELSGLAFSYPNGLPASLSPGVGTTVRVDIEEGSEGFPVATTEMVNVQVNGGGFSATPMVQINPGEYEATIPGASCFDVVEFFFSADASVSGMNITDPSGGASEAFSAIVRTGLANTFADNFQSDMGWSVVNDVSLTDGAWERGVPAGGGTRNDPPVDGDGSGQCYLTDNVSGNSDVDGGPTQLISPTVDMSSGDGQVSYLFWHECNTGEDTLDVEVSGNGGGSWVSVTSHFDGTGWRPFSFTVGDFVTPSANVQVRFSVSDNPNGSITESGIDAFSVDFFTCEEPGDAPDLAIAAIQIDYDPSDGDVDAGPGAIAQAADVVVTIRNEGNTTINQASIMTDANVSGGSTVSANTTFNGSLAPGGTADVVVSYAAGQLDRCGFYDVTASHDGSNLMSTGMTGSVTGDDDASDDSLGATSAIQLDFGTLGATIQAASMVIEDASTERVRLDLDYVGLGPGGDSHDVELVVDLTDLSGSVQYLNVFNRARMGVQSGGARMLTIGIPVDSLFPAPAPNSEFRLRLRLRDTNSNEVCITTLTTDSFLIQ